MSGRVDHDTSVLQKRSISYFCVWNFSLASFDKLRQRLKGVHISRIISIYNLNFLLVDSDLISFRLELRAGCRSQSNMFIFDEGKLLGAFEISIESFHYFIEVITSLDEVMVGWEMEDVAYMPDL